ncbi:MULTISPECIES: flagellar type III secretion system pore protein FliP [unclassified Agarivorans]|uniref:flagellar type III secretion system pore protein FliP n=1 Tax=unclassified Agarivorans TaxID=2636026 RepID=UPI0026E445F0|nr:MULTISPECIES: flagellar type III secretion system pore protein FliP [unclassified Agarivorans]MDO6685864.1 flagellar type III secretion system pore protein FliP [Agarivorans sp. 3_MG-2023]MDO6716021.1 flagellar type III secretion system pore protein FliP [Agarivorans sp. 2_MG-2023]
MGMPFIAQAAVPGGIPSLPESTFSLLEDDWQAPVKYLVMVTALSFIPAAMIAATSFTRIIIVLSMLRMALGLQSSPPNSVIVLLSLFLTFFSMSPVIEEVNNLAINPYLNQEQSFKSSVDIGAEQLKKFMVVNTEENAYLSLLEATNTPPPQSMDDLSYLHLVPAFMLSEIKVAFQMGFLIFIPFVLIDLIVASVLMGLGMIMVPPMTISMPLKILVFVLADGWNLLTHSLLLSFAN